MRSVDDRCKIKRGRYLSPSFPLEATDSILTHRPERNVPFLRRRGTSSDRTPSGPSVRVLSPHPLVVF